jgi:segregation and condensation protein B
MTEEQNAAVNDEPASPSGERGEQQTQKPVEDMGEAGDEKPESDDTITEPQPQTAEVEPGFEPTVESVVEAVLFASDESLTPARLFEIVGTNIRQLRKHIDDLNEKYKQSNNAFRIEQIAGGFQMLTLSAYSHWLKKLIRSREESSLSQQALETLAIIAYKQPIIRADVEAIRGVAAGEMIRNLMYKGLVRITGRAEVLGRPMLYGTTKKFLEIFGLNSLKDLPKVEELKRPPD